MRLLIIHEVKVYRLSAITLVVKNMEASCKFYSRIPGFKLVCGGASNDSFTTYEAGKASKMFLNLELRNSCDQNTRDFGRIIFHTDDVDELYSHLKNDDHISKLVSFENEPTGTLISSSPRSGCSDELETGITMMVPCSTTAQIFES